MASRRSKRLQADDHVTATFNDAGLQTSKTAATTKKKTGTSTGKKTDSKAGKNIASKSNKTAYKTTSKTTAIQNDNSVGNKLPPVAKSAPKRKAKDDGANSKKKRKGEEEMAGELSDDELTLFRKDVTLLLEPLLRDLGTLINSLTEYREETWYRTLKLRHSLIPAVPANVRAWEELADRQELKSPFTFPFNSGQVNSSDGDNNGDKTPEGYEHSYTLLQEKFKDLEKQRERIIGQALEPPAPSAYCFFNTYRRCQLHPQMAVRDGRVGTPPLPLKLLHRCFRAFTHFSIVQPRPLPGFQSGEAHVDDATFLRIYQAVNKLQNSMACFYSSHDERLYELRDALLDIFPENELYEWCTNEPADQGLSEGPSVRYKLDLVYRRKDTLVPFLFVEVKLEMGEGGNAFWQNHRLYQSYIREFPKARRNGAPVFFLQLCGTHLGVGGGFCDAQNKPPVVLQLGGYVNLQYDHCGRNLLEGVNVLWALYQGVQRIPIKFAEDDSQDGQTDIPRLNPSLGIKFTTALYPGVVYLAKHTGMESSPGKLSHVLTEVSPDSQLIVKVIYSGLANEHYGKEVHRYLAERDMAPKHFIAFFEKYAELPGPSLETYHVMEYLAPPTSDSGGIGWVTLHELGQRFPEVAEKNRQDIFKALKEIIHVLQEKGFVHGDFRTNNLLACVKITAGPDGQLHCIIQPRPGSPLPYLKVIDFDWSGVAGQVIYPPHRNPNIEWPGQAGTPIYSSHDQEMVSLWMNIWPAVELVQELEETATIIFEDA